MRYVGAGQTTAAMLLDRIGRGGHAAFRRHTPFRSSLTGDAVIQPLFRALSIPSPRIVMKKERLIPLIVATALFMENMDSTVIATSLPAIAADIGASPLTLKLAITSYLLSLA